MRVALVTLFPELFQSFFSLSLVGRAVRAGMIHVHFEHLREHGLGKHKAVDDTPYGGGSGMLLRVDCVVSSIESACDAIRIPGGAKPHRVLLSPQGRRFEQRSASRLARHESLVLVCGRYEGFDERIREFVDEEVSIGDFVLTGGEVGAMAVIEACARMIPGVLGNDASAEEESFGEGWGLLEYPQYTRPAAYRELEIPKVLTGGNHALIAKWRRQRALERTQTRRPDMLDGQENVLKSRPETP